LYGFSTGCTFSESPDASLYHYTSLTSLVGIATKRELWASHVYYLNDSKEIIHACELLDSTLDDNSVFDPDIRRSNFSSISGAGLEN